MTNSSRGGFIVFEGIDGTGKSSQVKLLADHLRKLGLDVLCTREPSDGPHGRQIRKLFNQRHNLDLEEEVELFILDRRQHVDDVIKPALRSGKVVICDRYYYSTMAYQGAAGLDPEKILARNAFAPVPDLVLLLVLSPQRATMRIRQFRGDQLNDFEQENQLKRVADMFDTITDPFVRRIDASGSIGEVHRNVLLQVMDILPVS